MSGWVGELALDVRAPPGRAAEAQARAERFARRVLELVADQIEARWPRRVILLRELAMLWRLDADRVGDSAEVAAVAFEVAASLLQAIEEAGQLPASDAMVAVFDDEAAHLVAYFDALAELRDVSAWYFSRFAEASVEGAGLPGDDDLCEALGRLSRSGKLAQVLPVLPREWFARVARVTGASELISGSFGAVTDTDEALGQTSSSPRDDLTTAIVVTVAVAGALGRDFIDPMVREVAAATFTQLSGRPRADEALAPARFLPPSLKSLGLESAVLDERATVAGGAVYLLTLAQSLGLGEILWQACLPEGRVFAEACALLLGCGVDDPLLEVLSGPVHGGQLAASDEQVAEVSLDLLRITSEAMIRVRGRVPSVRLGLRHTEAGRCLVAAEARSPFALFVAGAELPSDVTDAVSRFLSAWPGGKSRVSAPPGLAAVDRSGRVRPEFDLPVREQTLLGGPFEPAARALISQVAGTLGAVFAGRIGVPAEMSSKDLAGRHLLVAGKCRTTSDAVTVLLPMESIDLAVRKAGLDRDPGWVPWIERNVRVEFFEDDQPSRP
jgi:hypothetical protein